MHYTFWKHSIVVVVVVVVVVVLVEVVVGSISSSVPYKDLKDKVY